MGISQDCIILKPKITEIVEPESIFQVINSPEKKQKLIEDGFKRAAEFSWERCAKETLAVLEEVVNK